MAHAPPGAASATVEFENGFLELIYPDDSVPTSGGGGATAKARFTERAEWRETKVSPFGIAVRRASGTPDQFPFDAWRVTSGWVEPGTYMEMRTPRGSKATNIAVHPHRTDEAANRNAIAAGGEGAWPFLHPNGARRLTEST